MSRSLQIKGIAYLPEPGEEWIVPDRDVFVHLDMDPRRPIGRATLTGHDDGSMTCVAEIPETLVDGDLVLELKELPFLALTGARIDGAAYSVLRVSVVCCNVNPLIPPCELGAIDA